MKRILATALFAAAVSLLLVSSAAAQNTRTFSLNRGDTLTPASPSFDPSGATTYFGGLVAGQVDSPTSGVFTLSLAFRSTGLIDSAAGIYGGEITPYSSFVVNEGSGRKTVSTSGTIDAGTVTYRLTPDGRADILSVISNNLTVWEGKNKNRRAVGYGTIDYGTSAEGRGTLVLNF